jgi:uncharacterized protein (TIGR03086 family)
MNELRELHVEALSLADTWVAELHPTDMGRPTPCAEWSLADLLAHMIGQHRGFAQAIRKGQAPAEAYRPLTFDRTAWQDSVRELRAAFADAELSSSAIVVELAPTPLPVAQLVAAQLIDTVVHTWDIGQSVGADFTPPEDLVMACAAIAAAIPGTAYGRGRAFASQLPTDGDTWQQTLALVGRRPGALTGQAER